MRWWPCCVAVAVAVAFVGECMVTDFILFPLSDGTLQSNCKKNHYGQKLHVEKVESNKILRVSQKSMQFRQYSMYPIITNIWLSVPKVYKLSRV